MNKKVIGVQLRKARLNKGLSRSALAVQFGVSLKTIERWERGEYIPPHKYWEGLFRILGVNVASLFSPAENPPLEA